MAFLNGENEDEENEETVSFPSERVIEDYVYQKIINTGHCPIADESVDLVFRQKEIIGYGITDIIKVAVSPGYVGITILELKNETLKESHLGQISRYVQAVKRIVENFRDDIGDDIEICVTGELAGPFDPNKGDFVWLLDSIDGIYAYGLSLSMETGFSAKPIEKGWHKIGEDLSSYGESVKQIGDQYKAMIEKIWGSNEIVAQGDENAES